LPKVSIVINPEALLRAGVPLAGANNGFTCTTLAGA